MLRRLARLSVAALVVVVVAGCQVRTTVTVDMEDDGSGTVEVAVGLDAEALAEVPDLDKNGASEPADLTAMLRVDDLRAAGWTLGEPRTEGDGFTWVAATKPFGTPTEAAAVLNEITGAGGPLRDFRLDRQHGFGKTTYELTGTADLSGGIEVFGDAGLAAALDGEALGEDAAAIEQRYGKPIAELFTLKVTADLPDGGDSWEPVLGGEAVSMETSSTVWNRTVLGLAGLAAACMAALVVVFVVRTLRSRR